MERSQSLEFFDDGMKAIRGHHAADKINKLTAPWSFC